MRFPTAHTTIYFADGSTLLVPPGMTLTMQEGWVSVTDRPHMPDHELSGPGDGWVSRTRAYHSSLIARVESIREDR